MTQALTIKIDVTKIQKEHLFKGKKGTYLDLVLWPNREGEDQYGNTHYITQSLSKEARAKGGRGAILGNARPLQRGGAAAAQQESAPPTEPEPTTEDDVPF